MSALLLDPHGDDAVLFCCYTLLREKPHVVVTHPTIYKGEIAAAMEELGCEWKAGIPTVVPRADRIYAPAWHPDGHEQHNEVALLAKDWFGSRPIISYLTYAPRGQRSTWGTEVVPTAQEISLKLRALSCYESQIEQVSTRPWFFELLDLREWVV